jgi:trk system potassium uptake protein TrkA
MSKKSYLILGAGRFGTSIAETLDHLGQEVCVIDKNADIIQNIAENVTHAIVGDACEEGVLRSIGAQNFDVAVVALSHDMQASILITVLLKEMGVSRVLSRAVDPIHTKILQKVGADEVLMPEMQMAERLAYRLTSRRRLNDLELSAKVSVVRIECPPKWVGKDPVTLNLRQKYGINVVAVERHGEVNIAFSGEYKFEKNDILVVLGKNENIEALAK